MENLYVLGHPVAHSKSPAMHNALYRELGLDWRYELKDAPTEEEGEAFLRDADFLGINITMPYKPHAYRRAEWADSSAELAQGANVLVWEGVSELADPFPGGHLAEDSRLGKRLAAYNMDGYGCVRYLQREGVDFAGARVVVCGTGPTSLAIMHATIVAGATTVALMGRDAVRTQSVLDGWQARVAQTADAGQVAEIELAACDYAGGADRLSEAELIVDATPLGMQPGDPAPFDTRLLRACTFVFDVVYGHGQTALAAAARAAGCPFANGEGMLVGQAVLGAEKFLQAGGALGDSATLAACRGTHAESSRDVHNGPGHGSLDFDEAFTIMARAAGFSVR